MKCILTAIAVTALALSSCQQQCYLNDWMDSHIGMSREEIIQAWGTPEKTYKGEDGVETFKYYPKAWDNGGFWMINPGWVHYKVDFMFKGDAVTHWRYDNATCRVVPKKWLKANKKRINTKRKAESRND